MSQTRTDRPSKARPRSGRRTEDVQAAHWKELAEAAAEGFIACDLDALIEAWNPGAQRLFARHADETLGRPVTDLFAADDRETLGRHIREAAQGRRSEILQLRVSSDEGARQLTVTLAPRHDTEGRVAGFFLVARDVSARLRDQEEMKRDRENLKEREIALREALSALRNSHEELKSTQRQLMRAAKLESVGRLAAGVAHEVKNPLQIILAATDYLLGNPGLGPEQTVPVLREIHSAVIRGSSVIGGLLNYSAASDVSPTVADVNQPIEQALSLVHYALERAGVRVVKDLAPGLPMLSLDIPKIEQVFVNLLMNAADAMPEGGTITLRSKRTQLSAKQAGAGLRQTDPFRVGQTVVMVEVEDSGTGFPEENLSRLFDPFFTTKPTGKGTGLGLAVSRSIVAMHGGTIWARNGPERGAIVTVVLRNIVDERSPSHV